MDTKAAEKKSRWQVFRSCLRGAERSYKRFVPRSLRGALRGFKQEIKAGKIEARTRKQVRNILAESRPIKLELGAGGRKLDGWVSVDMSEPTDLLHDLRDPLPLPDNCVDEVYSSHVMEHLHYRDLRHLLTECVRVMKTDGLFRCAVPDARIFLAAYFNPTNFKPLESVDGRVPLCGFEPAYHYHAPIDYVNYMAYMDGHHRFLFDTENLGPILERAGFRSARARQFDPSIDPDWHSHMSIYFESRK